ncbi:MAG: phospholipase D-like domain-containing protein [Pseudohongiellaceae bacterium]|nr:phospholipase D-like domain-containing protein [Pseudohongiellaceae bacterium]
MIESFAFFWLLPPVHIVMAVIASCHALLHNRDSRGAFGWIAVCIILPIAGPVAYLLFGVNRVNTRAKQRYSTKLRKDDKQAQLKSGGASFQHLSIVGERLVGQGLSSCDAIAALENGESIYPPMLEAIANAKESVFLSTYIFDNDQTGKTFVNALAQAKARGVDTRVIIDGMGSLLSVGLIGRALRKAGVNFVRFNPLTVIPPALNINMRSHRKLLIVDSRQAFTGGANIGDRHNCQPSTQKHCARDIHFSLQGEIVDELEWAFLRDWYYCSNKRNYSSFKGSNAANSAADTWCRLVLDGPNKDLDRLNDLIVGIIGAARSRIWIMTPYFLPTLDLVGALIGAHLRGVDVRIFLPEENNIKLAHWASRNALRPLLDKHIPIYYQPGPFIHSKLMLIDSQYSLIGSANLDPRSLRLNYELGVEVFSDTLNASLSTYFQQRQVESRPLTRKEIMQRSIITRLRDSLAWLFSPYL